MKLKSIGTIVRSGIVVVGGSAVVLVTAENLISTNKDETFTLPIPTSIAEFSESTPKTSSKNTVGSMSGNSAIFSEQSSSLPQSSYSVSSEVRIEPPVSTENSISSYEPPENSVSETSNYPRSSEKNSQSVLSEIVPEQIVSVSISSSTTEIFTSTFSSSEPKPSSLSSKPQSSSSKPSSSSSKFESSSSKPESSSSKPESSSNKPESSSSKPESSSSKPESSSSVETSTSELPVISTTEQSSSVSTPTESSKPPEQSTNDTPNYSEPEEHVVNINTASSEELQTLYGIGEDKAEAIIAYRERYGDFVSIYDIRRVDGINDYVFEGMRDYITV